MLVTCILGLGVPRTCFRQHRRGRVAARSEGDSQKKACESEPLTTRGCTPG
jgi:hypothetical protein